VFVRFLKVTHKATPASLVAKGTIKQLLVGLIGGLLVGALIIFVLNRSDDRLNSSTEIIEHFTEPILGQIPDVSDARSATGLPLIQVEDERFAYAEAFRSLRSSLIFMPNQADLKTLLITSALPTDGKTLTATNIALTLSESYRRRVLLIDADLRRPALHQIFRVPNAVGLNEGLKAKGDGRLSVLKISDTLTLLPAGRPEPDPMSGLTSARMANIIEEAATRFDWVLVDTPPIGLLADANLLSVMTDGALLVIRANQTPHASVLKAVQALGRERILGVVLNGTESLGREAEYSQYYAPVVPPATR